MEEKKKTATVTIQGLFNTLLAIAFIVLKLCHVIDWAWIWVLAPLWLPLVLGILIFIGVWVWMSH